MRCVLAPLEACEPKLCWYFCSEAGLDEGACLNQYNRLLEVRCFIYQRPPPCEIRFDFSSSPFAVNPACSSPSEGRREPVYPRRHRGSVGHVGPALVASGWRHWRRRRWAWHGGKQFILKLQHDAWRWCVFRWSAGGGGRRSGHGGCRGCRGCKRNAVDGPAKVKL